MFEISTQNFVENSLIWKKCVSLSTHSNLTNDPAHFPATTNLPNLNQVYITLPFAEKFNKYPYQKDKQIPWNHNTVTFTHSKSQTTYKFEVIVEKKPTVIANVKRLTQRGVLDSENACRS